MLHPQKLIFAPGAPDAPATAPQFKKGVLSPEDLNSDPLVQFDAWYNAAKESGVKAPETCTFATAELPSGKVSARIVYMKELDARGFVVYSNWDTSRKASDVRSNPRAAITFWWSEMERQVRVEGGTERLSREESQVYFDTRIRGSRIGAWASRQSEVIADRSVLEGWVKEAEEKFEGQEKIPVPEFWGGVRVVPEMMEFWQGRESRLHDRLRYTKTEEGWKLERLSP
ncbi:pyridoxamine 5'-phosphate oxidase [Trichodelitschia bisporula]|uniref:pyridoxal 5'-phosphate synthase n=1 Tax=Trichodelitschia bisporula TaxID=703511 RepID=A0A6G1HL01_9PEZI|nr:pyridoxamine 5'-phosphate oxidase [Trichodelitschia bisporula]